MIDWGFVGLVGIALFSAIGAFLMLGRRNDDSEIRYIPSVPTPPVEPPKPPPTPVPVPEPPKPPMPTKREILYGVAKASIGVDMSPNDIAPDSLACAESLNGVFRKAFGSVIAGGSALTSTNALFKAMKVDPRFEMINPEEFLPGDITIAPTGYSTMNKPHGHCGVWGVSTVMSNDSDTGLWLANYTHAAWHNVFHTTLGFPIYGFRVKE